MRIWIDADACPREIKELLYRTAERRQIRVTLVATGGVLTLGTSTGLTFVTGDGTGDGTVVFEGTLAQVQAFARELYRRGKLEALSYGNLTAAQASARAT